MLDDSAGGFADPRWFSYQEIAAQVCEPASAAGTARLHRWPRRRKNSGVMVCAVPAAYAESGAGETCRTSGGRGGGFRFAFPLFPPWNPPSRN